jgi:mannose-6-phosphate isomerase-like protein (cupin superfamily)
MGGSELESIEPLIRTADEADLIHTDVERRVMARSTDTGGRLALTVVTCKPRYQGPRLHRHRDADEIFFILEGEFEFRAGDVQRRVGPGAFVFVPAGTPHAFANVSDKPGRQIVMYAPGGPERWFDELAALRARGASPDEFAAARERFGIVDNVVGPPLELGADA